MRLSAFAGGYTRAFSAAVIKGMEMDLPNMLTRQPWRAGEKQEAFPVCLKRRTDMDAEGRSFLNPLWEKEDDATSRGTYTKNTCWY